MLREPHFFNSTWFVVDRMHWNGHLNCSRYMLLAGFESYFSRSGFEFGNFSEFNDVVSVICEIYNAHFQRVVGHVGYMNRDHFMLFARHFMTRINISHRTEVLKKCTKGGIAADKIRRLNALISKWMLKYMPSATMPCNEETKCKMCESL